MGLINAQAFSILMHLCNSIQFILDSTKTPDAEISPETRKKLEVRFFLFLLFFLYYFYYYYYYYYYLLLLNYQ